MRKAVRVGLEAAPSVGERIAAFQVWPSSCNHDCVKPVSLERTIASIVVPFTTAIVGSGHRPRVVSPGIGSSTVQVFPCEVDRTVKAPIGASPQP